MKLGALLLSCSILGLCNRDEQTHAWGSTPPRHGRRRGQASARAGSSHPDRRVWMCPGQNTAVPVTGSERRGELWELPGECPVLTWRTGCETGWRDCQRMGSISIRRKRARFLLQGPWTRPARQEGRRQRPRREKPPPT